jgi:hypothetical protein
MDEADLLGDRIAIINNGKLVKPFRINNVLTFTTNATTENW